MWAGRLTGLRHLRRAHHRELHKDIGLPPGTEMSSVKGHSGGAVNPKWESRPAEAGEVCLATSLQGASCMYPDAALEQGLEMSKVPDVRGK